MNLLIVVNSSWRNFDGYFRKICLIWTI
jgi:hypothetical protein